MINKQKKRKQINKNRQRILLQSRIKALKAYDETLKEYIVKHCNESGRKDVWLEWPDGIVRTAVIYLDKNHSPDGVASDTSKFIDENMTDGIPYSKLYLAPQINNILEHQISDFPVSY